MLRIKFPGVSFASEKLNITSLLKNSWILFEGKARGGKTRSVLGYVSIFDDEQRSHRTKDGIL
jgi:hypothetical protein